jgi:hypothetical protein
MVQGDAPRAEDQISVNDAVMLSDLAEGTKVRLRSGAIAEVTANPRDGGWIFIRVLEHPSDPSKIGEEDMAFCTDVISVVS